MPPAQNPWLRVQTLITQSPAQWSKHLRVLEKRLRETPPPWIPANVVAGPAGLKPDALFEIISGRFPAPGQPLEALNVPTFWTYIRDTAQVLNLPPSAKVWQTLQDSMEYYAEQKGGDAGLAMYEHQRTVEQWVAAQVASAKRKMDAASTAVRIARAGEDKARKTMLFNAAREEYERRKNMLSTVRARIEEYVQFVTAPPAPADNQVMFTGGPVTGPGKRYLVEFDLTYIFTRNTARGDLFELQHTTMVREEVFVGAGLNMPRLNMFLRALQQWRDGKGWSANSEVVLADVSDSYQTMQIFDMDALEYEDFLDLEMQSIKFLYNKAAAGQEITAVPGHCVLDYILWEYHNAETSKRKTVTREELIAEFQAVGAFKDAFHEEGDPSGLTTRHVLAWARQRGDVSVYALDMFWRVARHHVAIEKTRICLFFMCNNRHCYPLLDRSLRASITKRVSAASGRTRASYTALADVEGALRNEEASQLTNVTSPDPAQPITSCSGLVFREMKLTFSELEHAEIVEAPVFDTTEMHIRDGLVDYCLDCIACSEASVLVLPVVTLDHIMVGIARQTNTVPDNILMHGEDIYAFEHPTTHQILVSGLEYEARKDAASILYARFHLKNFLFVNQSWAVLANTMFETLNGALPASRYSFDLMRVFSQYPVGPYRWQDGNVSAPDNVQSIDTRRAYTSILMNNTTPWPVFSAFDCAEPVHLLDAEDLVCGEAYVSKATFTGRGAIYKPAGWYPVVWVKHLLRRGIISCADVTHVIRPSSMLPADAFAPFADAVTNTCGEYAKYMINSFVGSLGMHTSRACSVAISTDMSSVVTAISTGDREKRYTVRSIGEFHVVREISEHERCDGHVPLYRAILASAWIALDEIASDVCGEDAYMVAMNTDSVKFVGPYDEARVKQKEDAAPGEFYHEDSSIVRGTASDLEWEELLRGIMTGPTLDILVNRAPKPMCWETEWRPETTQLVDDVPASGCLVVGVAGSGKSHAITTLTVRSDPDDSASPMTMREEPGVRVCVLAYTNAACERLRSDGVTCQTFDSLLWDNATGAATKWARLHDYDVIIVDEFTMLPPNHMSYLVQAKLQRPTMRFLLFGDPAQCPAPVENWVAYERNASVAELCNWTRVDLTYKYHRYDDAMYAALTRFREYGALDPGAWMFGAIPASFSICATNKFRVAQNTSMLHAWCAARGIASASLVHVNKGDYLRVAPGVPLMVYHGTNPTLGLYKTQRYVVRSVDADSKSAELVYAAFEDVDTDFNMDAREPRLVDFSTLTQYFDYAFCATAHKIQGVTLRMPYNVYEAERMDRNVLYTALSRGTTLSKIGIVLKEPAFVTACTWCAAVPPDECFVLSFTTPKTLTGRILDAEYANGTRFWNWSICESEDQAAARLRALAEEAETTLVRWRVVEQFYYVAPTTRREAEVFEALDSIVRACNTEHDEHEQLVKQLMEVEERRISSKPHGVAFRKQTVFNILEDTTMGRFEIRCSRANLPRIRERFSYSKKSAESREKAYAAAQARQSELRLQYGF